MFDDYGTPEWYKSRFPGFGEAPEIYQLLSDVTLTDKKSKQLKSERKIKCRRHQDSKYKNGRKSN